MFRPAWNNPYGFDASGSVDLTLPPPTMLTEAFVIAHTEVLRQLLQTQQRMAQQLPRMPLLTVYFGAPSMFITLWFGFDYGTNPPLGTLII
jgi:hypothetical protein